MSELERPVYDPRRTVALVVGILAAIAFVILSWVIYVDGRQPLAPDLWWHGLMIANLTKPGVVIAWVPSIVGGTIGMIVIAIVLVVVFIWRKRRWDAANIAIAIALVVAIGAPMSYIVARARPSDSLAESTATSFPSGHTAVATTVVVTLALLLRKWYVWVGGVLWVLWMMWARTYLHAHWLSDVIAGLLEGIAVATLVWCAMEAIRDRRAMRSRDPAPTKA
ncbi:phosphatase PAP2 family protein [Microbacterium rhizosphaerae]|uniref:Phosphatase PAP2 family protein n=1 Tax=Microbacterium rhizosphaerae TaxID=1678237 RepID=A0ABZ0SMM6_9MICO|nr:phosphatase PAP2 family protein [Microbacterium rhizosphaerae]WPR89088.1 phosphatase PAP2 family protein [Microbacterium rhizosphaerae]